VMNERLVGHPLPPQQVDPNITPQLQEVLYRALEREPKNRYSTAHEFGLDLTHLDRVGIADRPELSDWRRRGSRRGRTIALYVALALIPLLLFAAMLLLAHSHQATGR
jgi:eukaryotic-like serine/threonine-protein kinase